VDVADTAAADAGIVLGLGEFDEERSGVGDIRDEARKERITRDKVCLAVELDERGLRARRRGPLPSPSPARGPTHRRGPRRQRDGRLWWPFEHPRRRRD